MRAVINSEKHIVQMGINSVMGGTINNVELLRSVNVSDVTGLANQVTVGTEVKAVYIELWLLVGQQQPGSITVSFEKKIADSTVMSFTDSASLHTYGNKKNVLYITQGITPDANGNPIPFLRQWVKIPKGKKRMGLGDQLRLNISANVEDCTFCGLVIYKGYT